jgi:multidrug efflux system membrane fusion protein
MRIVRRILVVLILCGLAAGGVYYVLKPSSEPGRRAGRGAADGPVPVLASEAKTADVPVYLVGVGTVRALNLVTVHSQVNGTLIKVNFQEGQDVKRGDVLALIDPSTYKAQYDQAVAKKALDQAQLANAKLDLERYTNLVRTNAASKQQLDTQRALVDQLTAQVALDQGAIDNAKTYLDWCTITAPLSGRLGIRLVDEGNIVNASDPGGIVVITQIQPISVLFSLPQQNLGKVNAAFAAGPTAVEAMDADNKTVLDQGKLTVVNNQVDQSTGTVQLKAEFANSKLQLWPGQFVNVRLLISTIPKAVVVASAAVQRGPNGEFVYVVQPDDTVKVRNVKVTQQDERQAVIAEGVQPGDRVVTSGFVQLADGRKVSVTTATATPAQGGQPDQGSRPDGGNRPEQRDPNRPRRGQGRTSSTSSASP